ncbi:hypothetical protein ACHAXN_004696 [Cyclotella atomus]|jgi:hypothetical protein
MVSTEYFTPQWQRPRRKHDVIPSSPTPPSSPFWHQYPCLICGKCKNESSENPKRCSRCKSTVYCSLECQRIDFGEGKHKACCNALAKLWTEKERLEKCLWYGSIEKSCSKSTNPFDDDYEDPDQPAKRTNHEYAVVGRFWHDEPETQLQKYTTQYCITLLQLIQLLGRGESWRCSRIASAEKESIDIKSCWRGMPLNPLSLELGIDVAFTLFHLDQTDRRVRLLIPSMLLEAGYFQEFYDFVKYWTLPDGCLEILDLALPGGAEDTTEVTRLLACDINGDMAESPTLWMDGEIVYPSLGMVFELAYFKCHMLILLQNEQANGGGLINNQNQMLIELATRVGEEELQTQVKLLLSLVHKWNAHLLPKLGNEPYDVCHGASSSCNDRGVRTPPALDSLLNLHPPGFELQYSFGNPGGGSIEEAVSIWQRDMILWHVMNPLTMEYLSQFCSNLEANLVDTSTLTGESTSGNSSRDTASKSHCKLEVQRNAAAQRKEAEDLVARLQRENPERTMDQIMMHPEMAALMIKHLHTQ